MRGSTVFYHVNGDKSYKNQVFYRMNGAQMRVSTVFYRTNVSENHQKQPPDHPTGAGQKHQKQPEPARSSQRQPGAGFRIRDSEKGLG